MFIKHRIRVLTLILLPFLLSCDFRIPQAWETPTWMFDLTIPLINEEYSMSEIADGNDIAFDIDTTHFLIEMIDTIIDSGDVETDESFFIIDGSTLPLSLDPITISNNDIDFDIPPLAEEITIEEFMVGYENLTCLPISILEEGYQYDGILPIESMCSSFDIECIESVNWIKIQEGDNTLIVDNSFPFEISSISVEVNEYLDEDGDGEYTDGEIIGENLFTVELEDIGDITSSIEEALDGIELTCEILGQVHLSIDPIDTNNSECNFYESLCEEYGGIWNNDNEQCQTPIDQTVCENIVNGTWINDICHFEVDAQDELTCEYLGGIWDEQNNLCFVPLNQNLCEDENIDGTWINDICYLECTGNEQCCEALEGTWQNDNCELPFGDGEGLNITGGESIEISNEISIESFESINVDISDCSFESPQEFPLPVDEGIQLIEGHISTLEDIDINRIDFDLTNNYFSPLEFTLKSDNLVNSDGISLNVIDTIDVGTNFEDIILSDYTILNPQGGAIDNMSIDISAIINNQENLIINFDQEYGLDGSGVELTTIELDQLSVILSEFTTPPIDMGSIPSGFEGFDLPFLTFNLYLKNQIAANMKLVLDISGVSDDAEISIHVEPEISFPIPELDPYIDTDTLTITFIQDDMIVSSIYHDPDSLFYELDHNITDLFSYDQINVSGYALMNGDATLIPERGLWGELEILVSPLTIIFEDQMSFVPQEFTPLSPMDSEIATKIDSGLILGELGMHIENSIPFGGNLLMYISNAEEFPLCIDSLTTGTIENQNDQISPDCISILDNELGCSEFSISYYDSTLTMDDSTFVKRLDCITSNDEYYFKSLLNLEFLNPILSDSGMVISPSTYDTTFLLDEELHWFTEQQSQYLIPRFVFNNDLQDTMLTFQPSNYMSINSILMLKMLNTGLLEE